MGTTLTALTGDGLRSVWVLAIEGYDYLLTDCADPTDLFVAGRGWQGSAWSQALAGLTVTGTLAQSLEPWDDSMRPSALSFAVIDYDRIDRLGIDVHRGAAGTETRLTSALAAGADEVDLPAGIPAAATSAFAADADVYIGLERIGQTGQDATHFGLTDIVRGKFSPFTRSGGGNFSRAHSFYSHALDVATKPIVSDAPRLWLGRQVGLWLHRSLGLDSSGREILDTKAQAQLAFAGTIADIQDTPVGATVISCQDMRAVIRDAVLLRDQYVGRVAEGIRVWAGMWIDLESAYLLSGAVVVKAATRLTGTVGASGTNQIEVGTYTAAEFVSALNDWLQGEVAAARLTGSWSCAIIDGTVRVRWTTPALAGLPVFIAWSNNSAIWNILGNVTGTWWEISATGSSPLEWAAGAPPTRVYLETTDATAGGTIALDSSSGSWWTTQESWLPQQFRDQYTVAGEDWGVFEIRGHLYIGKHVSDTSFTGVRPLKAFGTSTERAEIVLREGDDGHLEIRQVAMLSGSLKNVMLRLLASTGGTGTSGPNHATYDAWPAQLGAAIPYELLSTAMETSLDTVGGTDHILCVIEQPTKLSDVLRPELLLRMAWLVWKNGGYRLATWQRASGANLALHTLTEASKASADADDAQRVATITTADYLRNVLKVEHNRDPSTGVYRTTTAVYYTTSIDDYGTSKPLTIAARNSYSLDSGMGTSVDHHLAFLAGVVLPLFGRPLKVLRNYPVNLALFENVAPGDLVAVSDNHVRDPSTGARGLTGKPGMILSHRVGWGGDGEDAFAEIDILFADFDDEAPYAPTAQVDDTAGGSGYSASPPTLTCYAHQHSESSEAVDASHFAASDLVYIVEIDPATAASPTAWSRTVSSVSGNGIVLTVALSSPAWDSAKKYRIYSQTYSAAAATQKTDSYQADDADLLVENARRPYVYGLATSIAFTAAASTELPERHATAEYGDGKPLAVALHTHAARAVNNFVDYKLAIQSPTMLDGTITGPSGDTSWRLVLCQPYYGGPGILFSGLTRTLSIAPMFRASGGAGEVVSVRITLSLVPPTGANRVAVTFAMPYKQVTFAATSTTAAIATAQNIAPVMSGQTGLGWMTVEIRANTASAAVPVLYGVATMQQNARS